MTVGWSGHIIGLCHKKFFIVGWSLSGLCHSIFFFTLDILCSATYLTRRDIPFQQQVQEINSNPTTVSQMDTPPDSPERIINRRDRVRMRSMLSPHFTPRDRSTRDATDRGHLRRKLVHRKPKAPPRGLIGQSAAGGYSAIQGAQCNAMILYHIVVVAASKT